MRSALSDSTASLTESPVFSPSNFMVRSDGNLISGRSAVVEVNALGDADADDLSPASAPAVLSLPLELSSPLPQADSDRAATAVSATAANRVGRRFTDDSRWGEGSHECANAIDGAWVTPTGFTSTRRSSRAHTHERRFERRAALSLFRNVTASMSMAVPASSMPRGAWVPGPMWAYFRARTVSSQSM